MSKFSSEKKIPKHITLPLNAGMHGLVASFKSTNIVIDNFLKSPNALNNSIGRTYVWISEDFSHIIGYYNICTGCMIQNLEGYSEKAGGSIHINEFAVDEHYHGYQFEYEQEVYNVSDILLMDCLERIFALQDEVGFSFVTLNSTKAGYSLYSRNAFEELEDDMDLPSTQNETDCIPMYLCLEWQ